MPQIKIAITGKMGAGKSTISKIIKEIDKNTFVTSYSSMIRKILRQLNLDPTRERMQYTGDFFRNFDQDVWTNVLLKETKDIKETIVVEGIRYEFERDKLVSNGFKIIKINLSDDLRKKRIEIREDVNIDDNIWISWQQHSTEKFVDQIKADFIINNNDSIEKVKKNLITILNQLKQ